MKTYIIERTNKRPLKFTGELIASNNYETGTGTRKIFELYKTESGKYIARRVYLTQWQGQSNKEYATLITPTYGNDSQDNLIKSLIMCFKLSDQAKNIYRQAGIDICSVIR